MKRLVSAALALSLLGATAAVADPYDHGNRGYNDSYGRQDRDGYHRDHRNNDGTAVVAGLSILALAAILASQNHHQHRYYGYDRGYDNYRSDYNSGYDRNDNGRYSHDGRDNDGRDSGNDYRGR